MGISDAGKTALFTQLRYGKQAKTQTSMKENEARISLLGKDGLPLTKQPVHLVDLPGHERLRFKFTDYTPIARGVVFVVDSATATRTARPIAEYLYDLLSNKHVAKNQVPVLIAYGHDYGAAKGKGADVVGSRDVGFFFFGSGGEGEAFGRVPRHFKVWFDCLASMTFCGCPPTHRYSQPNRLRLTRTAALEKQESSAEGEVFLGYEDQDFKFEHLENAISFGVCSVEKGEVAEVVEWITETNAAIAVRGYDGGRNNTFLSSHFVRTTSFYYPKSLTLHVSSLPPRQQLANTLAEPDPVAAVGSLAPPSHKDRVAVLDELALDHIVWRRG
ncbi:LOW QUALITY PROTEIN: signal recognition particle receptor beta subunit-domain-containing protein [Jimgerdemannia flammicorona]|uniref:Signal recognition particle receptor subunit beta n=1 Tax=Jimgerdemannia flammicorona TaxID=994334 RepID=A0A433DAN7_9FUNG|nr:LOW QUALITY PROTEIN: signal recognition particle receptor beta subunit-domain-containing protein [Jimgerdemannia flammicorona]